MLVKTRAILLRTFPYGESSVIVEALTEQLGSRRYIINGVRKAKPTYSPALVRAMSQVDLIVYEREGKDLQRIKDLQPDYVYEQVPFDLRRGTIGLFIIELVRKTMRESDPNSILFNYLTGLLRRLDTQKERLAYLPLDFLIDFSGYLGILPGGKYTDQHTYFDLREGYFCGSPPEDHQDYWSPPISQQFGQLLENDEHLHLSGEQRRYLLRQLLQYYHYHLDYLGEINTHKVLEEVFS